MHYESASITKRGDRGGRWVGYLRYRHDGKWRQTSKTLKTFMDPKGNVKPIRTKNQAEKALQQWRAEMEKNSPIPCSTSRFRDYASSCVDTFAADIDKRTERGYRRIAEGCLGDMGDVRLCDLNETHVQLWVDSLNASGLKKSTVQRYYKFAKRICALACVRKHMVHNPFNVTISGTRMRRHETRKPQALDMPDYEKLLDLLDDMGVTDELAVAAYIAAMAGLRQGECCGLQWGDYDEDTHMLTVARQVVEYEKQDGGIKLRPPKTESGVRTVAVHPRLAEVLKKRKGYVVSKLREAGIDATDEDLSRMFILSVDGSMPIPNRIGSRWRYVARRNKLVGTEGRPLRFHDLRDCFASVLLASNVDVVTVSHVIGHKDPSITLRFYASFLPSAAENAAHAMADHMLQEA